MCIYVYNVVLLSEIGGGLHSLEGATCLMDLFVYLNMLNYNIVSLLKSIDSTVSEEVV